MYILAGGDWGFRRRMGKEKSLVTEVGLGKERVKSWYWRLQKETGKEILEREVIDNGGWERGWVKSRTRNCKERQERRFMKEKLMVMEAVKWDG